MANATFVVNSFTVAAPAENHPKAKVRYYARVVCKGTVYMKGGTSKSAAYTLEFLRPDSILPWEAGFPYPKDSYDPIKAQGRSFLEAWKYTRVLQILASGQSRVTLSSTHPSSNRIEFAPATPGPAPGSPPDVQVWLNAHQPVANAIAWTYNNIKASPYTAWTAAERADLAAAFANAWSGQVLGLADPPANIGSGPYTVISLADARALYFASVAQSLAVEIGGWVPWSISGLTSDQLNGLFSPYEIVGYWKDSYQGYAQDSFVMSSPFDTVYRFLLNNRIIGSTRLQTIENLLEWCRANFLHALGSEPDNWVPFWGYSGKTPVSKMISGTLGDMGSDLEWAHWTGGCGFTSDFIRSVLRSVNIPVEVRGLANGVLDFSPLFPTELKSMSHGDDPYSRLSKATPEIPIQELLIDTSLLDTWFDTALPVEQQLSNVGRQAAILAVKYLPDLLLQSNERDKVGGLAPAQSSAYQWLKSKFTIQDLLAAQLWIRLDAKMIEFKGLSDLKKKKKKPPGPFAPKKKPYHSPIPVESKKKVKAKTKAGRPKARRRRP